jgi:hypothetical protein
MTLVSSLSPNSWAILSFAENTIDSLVFVGRVAVELSSSPFVTNIDCGEIMAKRML